MRNRFLPKCQTHADKLKRKYFEHRTLFYRFVRNVRRFLWIISGEDVDLRFVLAEANWWASIENERWRECAVFSHFLIRGKRDRRNYVFSFPSNRIAFFSLPELRKPMKRNGNFSTLCDIQRRRTDHRLEQCRSTWMWLCLHSMVIDVIHSARSK